MPVAGENQNQYHRSDDQNAGGLKLVDVGLGRRPVGRLIRRWAGNGHRVIVAPGLCGAGALARETRIQRWTGSEQRVNGHRTGALECKV